MNRQSTPLGRFSDSKPHFNILDGLRGAAAIMVVWYHVFEGFAFASGGAIETFNHGYLAVDFFFMLSGFVISYAYDGRWGKGSEESGNKLSGKGFTIWSFFKRRLIRLHPMVVMGAIIGTVSFLLGGSLRWDGETTSFGWILLAMLMGMCLIPAWPGAGFDVRGNGEMYSLNGPTWSLFFEYIGNILYAVLIRKLSGRGLAVLAAILGVALGWFAITDVSGYGMIGVGWTLDAVNFFGGLVRMLFPFTLGMVLARNFKPLKVRGIFWIAAAALFVLFSVPYIPACREICLNGVYEIVCISLIFPIILWLGASGATTDKISTATCNFLGAISYPLYVVHYPVMYLFYQWLIKEKIYTLGECWPVVLCVMGISLALAWFSLKFWETPIRKWLGGK